MTKIFYLMSSHRKYHSPIVFVVADFLYQLFGLTEGFYMGRAFFAKTSDFVVQNFYALQRYNGNTEKISNMKRFIVKSCKFFSTHTWVNLNFDLFYC